MKVENRKISVKGSREKKTLDANEYSFAAVVF